VGRHNPLFVGLFQHLGTLLTQGMDAAREFIVQPQQVIDEGRGEHFSSALNRSKAQPWGGQYLWANL
jgi:hypothetical protein